MILLDIFKELERRKYNINTPYMYVSATILAKVEFL